MARKIVIKRRRRPDVIRMSATKFPQPSFGAGGDNTHSYHCAWCFSAKKTVTEKCSNCGRFGSSRREQKSITQVYREDNPVFLEDVR